MDIIAPASERMTTMTDRSRMGAGPSPVTPRWRWPALSLPWRRAAVIATYLGAAVTIALIWARASGELPGWTGWLAFMSALIAMAGFAGICTTATEITRQRVPFAERDSRISDYAYRRAYWIVAIVTLFALVYAMFAADRPSWWLPDSQQEYWSIFVALGFLSGSLPTAIVAWIEPDVAGDDENR